MIVKELNRFLWSLVAWRSLIGVAWVGCYVKVWVDNIRDDGWGE